MMDHKSPKNVRSLLIPRIVLHIICCLIAGAGVLIIARSIVNFAFLKNYEKGSYSEMPERALSPLRFGENYVVPYNLGNIAYQLGDYEKAVTYFQQALKSRPPEQFEECKIRVNLALSMCHTIDFENLDRSDKDAVEEAVNTLLNARTVLTVHECASEEADTDDGHFADADLLKHDIDDMLNELRDTSDSGDSEEKESDPQDEEDQNEGDEDENEDRDEDENSEQNRQQEQARQDELKDQLDQQKKDLENGTGGSEGNGFHYIDGGNTSGYGDGTLW